MIPPLFIGAALAGGVVQGAAALLGADAQDEAAKQNRKSAKEAARVQLEQQIAQHQQIRQNASRSIFEADLEARRADAITRVSAGESGVEGISVDMVLNDIERQRLQASTDTQMNLANQETQMAIEKRGIDAQMRSRIAAVPESNPWATALQIGGAGLGAVTNIYGRMPTET